MKTTTNLLDDARKLQQTINGSLSKRCTLLAFCAALTLTTGCAALGTRGGNREARFYPGVRWDVQLMTDPASVNRAGVPGAEVLDGVCVVMGTADLVPSALVDTLWLPFDLVPRHAKPSPKPEQTPSTTASSVSTNLFTKTE
jgi:uncharacterized protein YceK